MITKLMHISAVLVANVRVVWHPGGCWMQVPVSFAVQYQPTGCAVVCGSQYCISTKEEGNHRLFRHLIMFELLKLWMASKAKKATGNYSC